MSNLQVIARRCPVMSKALAVQSARLVSTKRFTSSAAGVPQKVFACKRALHTTGGNGASVDAGTYENAERSMSAPRNGLTERGFFLYMLTTKLG